MLACVRESYAPFSVHVQSRSHEFIHQPSVVRITISGINEPHMRVPVFINTGIAFKD